jgi:hypothetical protein
MNTAVDNKKHMVFEALQAKTDAMQRLDYADNPDLIEAAVYDLAAAEKRLSEALRKVREYDETAGNIETPSGTGKFVKFEPHTGKVIVEMDNSYLVSFDGRKCYPVLKGGKI